MPEVAAELAQTAELWTEALGPVVEDIAQQLHRLGSRHGRHRWLLHRASSHGPERARPLPTPLTERNRRRARPRREASMEQVRIGEWPTPLPTPRPLPAATETARVGHPPRSLLLTETDLRQDQHHRLIRLLAGFEPMTRESFQHAILPALREIPPEEIAVRVGLSVTYCAKIRAGACVPQKKHWGAFRVAVGELIEGCLADS